MPRIGPYVMHSIEAGRFRLDGGSMFGVVPKSVWQRRVDADDRNRIPLVTRCLLLEGAGRLILVDTGIGHKQDDWFTDAFAVDFDAYDLRSSLMDAGFTASDVTDVILTHLHFDHAGGSTELRDGRAQPTFRNAQYWVQQGQWESAHDPDVREAASFISDNFDPLLATGQLNLIQGSQELFPGIEVVVINGHTKAQQMVKVSGKEGALVYVADLLPLTHHIRAPWVMAYDVQPLLTLVEKRLFLEEAHTEGYHLFFEHDPDAVIANVTQGRRGYEAASIRPLAEL